MGKTRQKQGVANASSADPSRLAASELLKDASPLSSFDPPQQINHYSFARISTRQDHHSSTEWVVGPRFASANSTPTAPSLAWQPLITPIVLSGLVQLITPEKAA